MKTQKGDQRKPRKRKRRRNADRWVFFFNFLKRFYLFLLRERGREGEREGEKHQCVVASHVPPTGDVACNPGMCTDWESNWQPFDLQAGTQSTEPQQPGLLNFYYEKFQIHVKLYKTVKWSPMSPPPSLHNYQLMGSLHFPTPASVKTSPRYHFIHKPTCFSKTFF